MSNSWDVNGNYLSTAEVFVHGAKCWNSEVFGNIFKHTNRILDRLGSIQRALERYSSTKHLELETASKQDLEAVLTQKELLWYQKSRREWIQFGNRNTTYFR